RVLPTLAISSSADKDGHPLLPGRRPPATDARFRRHEGRREGAVCLTNDCSSSTGCCCSTARRPRQSVRSETKGEVIRDNDRVEPQFVQFEEVRPYAIVDLVSARPLFGQNAMLNLLELEPGAIVPAHSHPHEQLGLVLRGLLVLTVDSVEH